MTVVHEPRVEQGAGGGGSWREESQSGVRRRMTGEVTEVYDREGRAADH